MRIFSVLVPVRPAEYNLTYLGGKEKGQSTCRDYFTSRSSIFLGVRENVVVVSASESKQHDLKQLLYIADAIGSRDSIVVDTFESPRCPNYKGNGPSPLERL